MQPSTVPLGWDGRIASRSKTSSTYLKESQNYSPTSANLQEKGRRAQPIQICPNTTKRRVLKPILVNKHRRSNKGLRKAPVRDQHHSPTDLTLVSRLGAGRVDPFNVYQERDLPYFVHEIVDHAVNVAAQAYMPTDAQIAVRTARSNLMENMMNQPLVWYSAIMSAITHHAFGSQADVIPRSQELIRLSYRSKTLRLLQEDINKNGGVPSEQGLLAISTLIVYGGDKTDPGRFTHDDYNARKAFGKANDMHYYTSIHLDTSHWPTLCQFVALLGGPSNVKLAPMLGVFAVSDSCIAWRSLSPPHLQPFISTAQWLSMATHKADETAEDQEQKYLESFPSGIKDAVESPYAELQEILSHTRTIIVHYNQSQRRTSQPSMQPDLKHIHFARILLMHDLMKVRQLATDGLGLTITYEIIRLSLMAFMQLVLFPTASVNYMPARLLRMMIPLLDLAKEKIDEEEKEQKKAAAWKQQYGTATQGALDLGLFLWSWMLAGMLAIEHRETRGDTSWLDMLAPLVGTTAIKPESTAFVMVRNLMETYLWLNSECDVIGQQWWEYACSRVQKRPSR